MTFHHRGWLALTTIVIFIGYLAGGLLPFLIIYNGYLSDYLPGNGKIYFCSFLIGLLGANVQNSIYFARECNDLVTNDNPVIPTPLDSIGHLLKQFWGGVAAVFFVIAVKAGFFASFSADSPDMRNEAVMVISFVAGLRAFSILEKLSGIIK